MGKDRKVYKVLVGKPEGKKEVTRNTEDKWDGIKVDLR
jgi:hypothetical protein